ncbi:MAG: hypothetical protein BGO10_00795 [Chlamydia sp. 32-24]|nr:MAG: hypothetical protein BGO10_00795 [Chlamydia sp. 32-24]
MQPIAPNSSSLSSEVIPLKSNSINELTSILPFETEYFTNNLKIKDLLSKKKINLEELITTISFDSKTLQTLDEIRNLPFLKKWEKVEIFGGYAIHLFEKILLKSLETSIDQNLLSSPSYTYADIDIRIKNYALTKEIIKDFIDLCYEYNYEPIYSDISISYYNPSLITYFYDYYKTRFQRPCPLELKYSDIEYLHLTIKEFDISFSFSNINQKTLNYLFILDSFSIDLTTKKFISQNGNLTEPAYAILAREVEVASPLTVNSKGLWKAINLFTKSFTITNEDLKILKEKAKIKDDYVTFDGCQKMLSYLLEKHGANDTNYCLSILFHLYLTNLVEKEVFYELVNYYKKILKVQTNSIYTPFLKSNLSLQNYITILSLISMFGLFVTPQKRLVFFTRHNEQTCIQIRDKFVCLLPCSNYFEIIENFLNLFENDIITQNDNFILSLFNYLIPFSSIESTKSIIPFHAQLNVLSKKLLESNNDTLNLLSFIFHSTLCKVKEEKIDPAYLKKIPNFFHVIPFKQNLLDNFVALLQTNKSIEPSWIEKILLEKNEQKRIFLWSIFLDYIDIETLVLDDAVLKKEERDALTFLITIAQPLAEYFINKMFLSSNFHKKELIHFYGLLKDPTLTTKVTIGEYIISVNLNDIENNSLVQFAIEGLSYTNFSKAIALWKKWHTALQNEDKNLYKTCKNLLEATFIKKGKKIQENENYDEGYKLLLESYKYLLPLQDIENYLQFVGFIANGYYKIHGDLKHFIEEFLPYQNLRSHSNHNFVILLKNYAIAFNKEEILETIGKVLNDKQLIKNVNSLSFYLIAKTLLKLSIDDIPSKLHESIIKFIESVCSYHQNELLIHLVVNFLNGNELERIINLFYQNSYPLLSSAFFKIKLEKSSKEAVNLFTNFFVSQEIDLIDLAHFYLENSQYFERNLTKRILQKVIHVNDITLLKKVLEKNPHKVIYNEISISIKTVLQAIVKDDPIWVYTFMTQLKEMQPYITFFFSLRNYNPLAFYEICQNNKEFYDFILSNYTSLIVYDLLLLKKPCFTQIVKDLYPYITDTLFIYYSQLIDFQNLHKDALLSQFIETKFIEITKKKPLNIMIWLNISHCVKKNDVFFAKKNSKYIKEKIDQLFNLVNSKPINLKFVSFLNSLLSNPLANNFLSRIIDKETFYNLINYFIKNYIDEEFYIHFLLRLFELANRQNIALDIEPITFFVNKNRLLPAIELFKRMLTLDHNSQESLNKCFLSILDHSNPKERADLVKNKIYVPSNYSIELKQKICEILSLEAVEEAIQLIRIYKIIDIKLLKQFFTDKAKIENNLLEECLTIYLQSILHKTEYYSLLGYFTELINHEFVKNEVAINMYSLIVHKTFLNKDLFVDEDASESKKELIPFYNSFLNILYKCDFEIKIEMISGVYEVYEKLFEEQFDWSGVQKSFINVSLKNLSYAKFLFAIKLIKKLVLNNNINLNNDFDKDLIPIIYKALSGGLSLNENVENELLYLCDLLLNNDFPFLLEIFPSIQTHLANSFFSRLLKHLKKFPIEPQGEVTKKRSIKNIYSFLRKGMSEIYKNFDLASLKENFSFLPEKKMAKISYIYSKYCYKQNIANSFKLINEEIDFVSSSNASHELAISNVSIHKAKAEGAAEAFFDQITKRSIEDFCKVFLKLTNYLACVQIDCTKQYPSMQIFIHKYCKLFTNNSPIDQANSLINDIPLIPLDETTSHFSLSFLKTIVKNNQIVSKELQGFCLLLIKNLYYFNSESTEILKIFMEISLLEFSSEANCKMHSNLCKIIYFSKKQSADSSNTHTNKSFYYELTKEIFAKEQVQLKNDEFLFFSYLLENIKKRNMDEDTYIYFFSIYAEIIDKILQELEPRINALAYNMYLLMLLLFVKEIPFTKINNKFSFELPLPYFFNLGFLPKEVRGIFDSIFNNQLKDYSNNLHGYFFKNPSYEKRKAIICSFNKIIEILITNNTIANFLDVIINYLACAKTFGPMIRKVDMHLQAEVKDNTNKLQIILEETSKKLRKKIAKK